MRRYLDLFACLLAVAGMGAAFAAAATGSREIAVWTIAASLGASVFLMAFTE